MDDNIINFERKQRNKTFSKKKANSGEEIRDEFISRSELVTFFSVLKRMEKLSTDDMVSIETHPCGYSVIFKQFYYSEDVDFSENHRLALSSNHEIVIDTIEELANDEEVIVEELADKFKECVEGYIAKMQIESEDLDS